MGLLRRSSKLKLKLNTSLRAYLLRSVRNASVDLHRREKRDPAGLDRAGDIADLSHQRSLSMTGVLDRLALVRAALDSLPETQGEVVRQRVFGRLSYEAIASEVGAPAATVRTRYRAALHKLKHKLKGVIDDE